MKVETNTVIRGTVFDSRELELCAAAQAEFGRFVAAPVVSDAELFGGKLVAALDRQHPRDLFDARYILDSAEEGPALDRLRLGFLAMLLSHDRPPHKVLRPNIQDRAAMFTSQFAGMARLPFTLEDHRRTLDDLLTFVPNLLPGPHRDQLVGFVNGEPDWSQVATPEMAGLPAIRWKLPNLRKLRVSGAAKHAGQADRLRRTLDGMSAS